MKDHKKNKMKKIFVYSVVMAALLATSCDDSLEITEPHDFNVTTEKATYSVGEEITFQFSGTPGIITCYTGETGNDYAYKDGRTLVVNSAELSMNTANPTATGAQPRQYSVWLSTDFNGNYSDFSHITAATWTEITSRFTYSTNATFTPAGNLDLSEFIVPGKPLYVGFRYITRPQQQNGVVRRWLVENFAMRAITPTGSILLANLPDAGFRFVEQHPVTAPSQSTLTATRLTLWGNNFTPDHDPASETWAISRGFVIGDIDLGPDRPIKVRGNSDAPTESFTYTYATPGTYKVHFIATNATAKEQTSVIRELNLEITP